MGTHNLSSTGRACAPHACGPKLDALRGVGNLLSLKACRAEPAHTSPTMSCRVVCAPPPFKDRAVLRTALSLLGGRKHLKVRRRPPSTSRPYRSPMLGSEPARPKGGPSRTTTQSEPLPEGELRKRIAPRLRAHSRERTHARTHASSIRSAARNLVHCVGVAAHGASSWPSEASELKLSCADLPECASLANDSKLCTLSCAHFRT